MSSSKNLEFEKTAFLSKSNSAFIEEMYMTFVNKDPSLPDSWKKYFDEIYAQWRFTTNESSLEKVHLLTRVFEKKTSVGHLQKRCAKLLHEVNLLQRRFSKLLQSLVQKTDVFIMFTRKHCVSMKNVFTQHVFN